MEINTETRRTAIELEGGRYYVAEKTGAVVRELREIDERARAEGWMPWEFELEQLKILLGDEVVNSLFADGENENVTRIDRVYAGAMEAFNWNDRQTGMKRLEDFRQASEELKPIVELLKLMGKIDDGSVRLIHREDSV